MKMLRSLSPWCFLALVLIGSVAHADTPRFAYAIELVHDARYPVQTFLLDVPIYESLQRTDLGDLRVLNAEGETVAHAIRPLSRTLPPGHLARAEITFPIFPVRDPRPSDQRFQAWAIEAETREGGAIVRLAPGAREAPNADAGVTDTAYLIDATGLHEPFSKLRVKWEPLPGADSVVAIAVEESDDLVTWSSTGKGVLAHMEHAGYLVDRSEIELPSRSHRYLRLQAVGSRMPTITSVSTFADLQDAPREPMRTRLTARLGDKPNRYAFDVPGPIPVDSVAVIFPQQNTIVNAKLSGVSRGQTLLRTLWSGVTYRLADGPETSEPIALGGRHFSQLELEVADKGGGIGAGMPQLELRWTPEQLLFVARGDGPFSLVFGSAVAEPSAFNADQIPGITANLPDTTVTASNKTERDGKAALRKPEINKDVNTRTILLWSVLVFAVLLIAALALRVMRDRR